MLCNHVEVFNAVLSQPLAAGRKRIRCALNREVTALNQAEVRNSAAESLAENLKDSLVASIHWVVLVSLPRAVLCRSVDMADTVRGDRSASKGRNWKGSCKWAAPVDDVLSWLLKRGAAMISNLEVDRPEVGECSLAVDLREHCTDQSGAQH